MNGFQNYCKSALAVMDMEKEENFIDLAHSFFRRVRIKRDEAFDHLEKGNHPECILASQECMEFSLKAIFYYFSIVPKKQHEFSDEEFNKLLKKIPQDLEYLNFSRLLLISQFWGRLYLTAKYGKEMLGIGSEKIFTEKEAKLALSHAEECLHVVTVIRTLIFHDRRFE